MIGEYARYYGRLVKIVTEPDVLGRVQINVLKTKERFITFLTDIKHSNLQVK